MLAEMANCVPTITPLAAKCYGTKPADVFFRVDSGKTRTTTCSSGVKQGGPMGSVMFCLALRLGLKRFREEFEGEGVEAFAYMDDVPLGLMGVTTNTARAFAFLRRELEAIGIVVNTAKTVALPPKGHAPTAEEISLLESVGVRIENEGGMTVVDIPIVTDEYLLERALEAVRDGVADHLSCCLANMPDKQAATLIAIESLGQRTSYLLTERALDTGLSIEACRRADNGAQWAYEKSSSCQEQWRHGRFPGGLPVESADFEPSLASPSTPFYQSGSVRGGVDGSEANVCLHWKHGGDPTGGSNRSHGPVGRPSEEGAP